MQKLEAILLVLSAIRHDKHHVGQYMLNWRFIKKIGIIIGILGGMSAIIGVIWTICCPPHPPEPPQPPITEIHVSAYSDPVNPPQYSKVLIHVLVTDQNNKPVANSSIITVAHYKTTKTLKTGMTNSQGECVLEYRISGATVGFQVNVTVEATYNELRDRTSTSFTPQSKYQ